MELNCFIVLMIMLCHYHQKKNHNRHMLVAKYLHGGGLDDTETNSKDDFTNIKGLDDDGEKDIYGVRILN